MAPYDEKKTRGSGGTERAGQSVQLSKMQSEYDMRGTGSKSPVKFIDILAEEIAKKYGHEHGPVWNEILTRHRKSLTLSRIARSEVVPDDVRLDAFEASRFHYLGIFAALILGPSGFLDQSRRINRPDGTASAVGASRGGR